MAHLIVDAMPAKIAKATLSQCAVSSGIATDKAIRLRGEGADIDPGVKLARLLGISVEQLPPTLQLEPGEELPEALGFIFDTGRDPEGAYEVENPSPDDDVNATEESGRAPVESDELSSEN